MPTYDDGDHETSEEEGSFEERAVPTANSFEVVAGGSALDSCSGSTLSCVKWMQYFRVGLSPLRMCNAVCNLECAGSNGGGGEEGPEKNEEICKLNFGTVKT